MAIENSGFGRRGRWVARIINSYDIQKRPRLTAWILATVVGIIAVFGLLGYFVPAVVVRLLKG